MPVVFVHGVGTRTNPEYWADVEMRTRLVRDFLFGPLGLPETALISFAYWGDHAAKFLWNHASLPEGGEEPLGAEEEALTDLVAGYADVHTGADEAFLLEVARSRSLGDALDVLVAAAADGATEQQAADVVAVVNATFASHDITQPPDWLDQISTDVEFLTELSNQVDIDEGEEEAFGSVGRGWARLREKLSRVRTAVPAVVSRAGVGFSRPRFHDQAATFIGDILVYLARPGARDRQVAILEAVADSIEAAASSRSSTDPLVVMAHSMGGNIVYDLLSYHRTDLSVDILITVGSQVGLFQELDLFEARNPQLNPPQDRVPKPQNIGRWINVYDRNDMLGFAASRIFEGVSDYEYGTGLGLLKAHSSYFIRPTFYQRLAARLRE